MFIRTKSKKMLLRCFVCGLLVTIIFYWYSLTDERAASDWNRNMESKASYLDLQKKITDTSVNVLPTKAINHPITNIERKYQHAVKIKEALSHTTVINSFYHDSIVFDPFNFSSNPLRIYVYDLPAMFNQDILTNASSKFGMCADLGENGYGTVLHTDEELVVQNTWQFSLEVIMHNKLLRSPYTTDDYSKANLFYVPFYSGISCLAQLRHNHSGPTLAQEKLFEELSLFLKSHPSNAFRGGVPHLMALSKIEKEQASARCPILRLTDFQSVYFLGIERAGHSSIHGNQVHPIIVVPYPSYGHLRCYSSSLAYLSQKYRNQRNVTIFMAAGDRNTGQPRRAIQAEMKAHATQLDPQKHTSSLGKGVTKVWLLTRDCQTYGDRTLNWMKQSVFCLQPPGDSPTRKSFYDSIVSGCVPVLFKSDEVGRVVYPFDKYLNYTSFTVSLDQSDILIQNRTVEELLRPYIQNPSLIAEKQRNLQKVVRFLQYSVETDLATHAHDAMFFIYEELRNILN